MPISTRRRQRGLTLVEASIALSLTAIVAGAALPGLHGLLLQRAVQGRAAELAADLQAARTEAIARDEGVRVTFQRGEAGSCYVVHSGAAGRCSCIAPGAARCDAGARLIKSAHLPATAAVQYRANVGAIVFDPVHGTASPAASVQVGDRDGRVVTHAVNALGRVRSCAPERPIAGYAAC